MKVNSRPVYFFHRRSIERFWQIKLDNCVFSGLDEFLLQCQSGESKRDFQKAIGHHLSLAACVEQCKAAIHYPPAGLSVLLHSANGTGKSIGVLDPLYHRAPALRIDGQVFLWMTLDLCRLEKEISDYPRRVLAAKYSIPEEHIVVSTIHTHSGPDISFEEEGEDRNRRKAVYREFCMKQIFAAADECFGRGFLEVTPYAVQGTIEGVYGKRNYKDKSSDKDVHLILFRNENHVVAGIFHFTCHPTVLGIHNMKISSDLLGNVGKALDEKYQTTFITMQGACGDMGNRQYRQGNDEKELWRVRDEIINQLDILGQEEKPLKLRTEKTDTMEYRICHIYDKKELESQIEADQKKLDNTSDEDQKKLLWSGICHLKQKMARGQVDISLCSQFFRLGDLEIATVPGELFSTFGMAMKEHMRASCTPGVGICQLQRRIHRGEG